MGRPTVAEVDLEALTHNVQQIRRHLKEKVEILAVVKADAYGHGAEAVAADEYITGISLNFSGGDDIRLVRRGCIHDDQVPQIEQVDEFSVVLHEVGLVDPLYLHVRLRVVR